MSSDNAGITLPKVTRTVRPTIIFQDTGGHIFDSREKVILMVDGWQLYNTDFPVDYARLKSVTGGAYLVRAIYYATRPDSDMDDESRGSVFRFQDHLRYSGWKVRTKPWSENVSMNVEIAVDALEMKDNADHFVLFSGDGDLYPVVKALQRAGKRVTIVSDNQSCATTLKKTANRFVNFDDIAGQIERGTAN